MKIAKDAIQAPVSETLTHPVGIDNALTPLQPILKPPGILATFANGNGMGQTPVAEFAHDEREIGAALMGVAGGLSAHYFKFLSPSATEPLLVTFLVWVMLMAGGSGNNRGAILGAVTIWFIWSATEIFSNRLPPDWITRSSYIRMLLVGLLLQFVLQRFRSGLLPEKSPKIHYDD